MRKRSEADAKKRKARDQEHESRNASFEESDREWVIDVPSDPVNEQVLIGAIALDPEFRSRARTLFPPEAFYAEEHRAIVTALFELDRLKLEYDPATLERLGGDKYDGRVLDLILDARPDVPPNVDFAVGNLLWDWKRAQVVQGPGASFLEAIQDPKESPDRVRALARQIGQAFEGEMGIARHLRDPKEVVRQSMERIRRRVEGEAHYPFGIRTLDFFEDGKRRLRPGAHPGHITLITAVSGSGKSTVTCHLVLGLARQKRKVLFGTWEVDESSTIELLAVLSLGWSRSRILDGKTNLVADDADLTEEEMKQLEERMHAISKWVRFFENPFHRARTGTGRRVRNDDNLDLIEEHVVESGCDIFAADLFERCLVDTKPEDEKAALYRTQGICKQHRIHGAFTHQQTHKQVEKERGDKRPSRENIKGSGVWLEVSNNVIAPHLPHKWKRVPDNTIELCILKQRDGDWPLAVEFDWSGEFGSIENGRSIPYGFGGETSNDAMDTAGFAPVSKRGKRR